MKTKTGTEYKCPNCDGRFFDPLIDRCPKCWETIVRVKEGDEA